MGGVAQHRMAHAVKVVIVGDGAIGKTCLLGSLLQDPTKEKINWDQPEYQPTAADNQTAFWTHTTADGVMVDYEVEVWDTAGQEALKHLRQMSYPDTHIFIVGYDMTKKTTLENIVGVPLPKLPSVNFEYDSEDEDEGVQCWMKEIRTGCEADSSIILVGTKCDLWEELQQKGAEGLATWEEGFEVAKAIGAAGFVCTSAKTYQGVLQAEHSLSGGAPDQLLDPDGVWLKTKLLEICTLRKNSAEIKVVAKPKPKPSTPRSPSPPNARKNDQGTDNRQQPSVSGNNSGGGGSSNTDEPPPSEPVVAKPDKDKGCGCVLL